MVSITNFKPGFEEVLAFFNRDIATLRTGRATPALIEQVTIEAYGTKSPLQHMASIGTPDARTLIVQPWDKGLLKDIERGISQADLNMNPIIEGDAIRISLPAMNEENRRAIVKLLNEKAEAARVKLRQLREKARTEITAACEAGDMGEDEKFSGHKHVEEMMKEYNERIKTSADEKEKEIMTL